MASVRGARGVFGDGASTVRPRNTVFEDIEPSHAWTEDSNGHYLLVDLPEFKKEQVKIQVNSSGHIKINGERPVNEAKRIRFEQTFKAPEKSDTNAITAKFDGEAQILYITVPKLHKIMEEVKREEPKPAQKPEPDLKPDGLKDQQRANGTTQEISARQKPDGDRDEAKTRDDIARDVGQGCEGNEKEQGGERNEHASSFSQESARSCEREPNYSLKSAIEMLLQNKGIVVTAMVAFSLGMFISRRFECEGVGE